MILESGGRLGRYEILSLLGRGGMGEVYKARDSRLDRFVAIKVILAPVASQADRLARFEREARAISALDHPNICALYDVGEAEGIHFIVIQYLEGQTLAERLTRGPLPVSQVLRYGVEIADALERAHRAGIVHRDLKPANIMLTRSGAKLLDFGLAKLHDEPAPIGLSSMTRLDALDVTADGTILGTYQYMAPEQVEGREADPRTDIFALGAVLYEAVTGNRAFTGPSPASVIGSILKDDPPPITTHAPLAPAAFEQLVQTCLAKDPEERWQSTADVRRQLHWIASTRPGSDVSGPLALPSRRMPMRWWLLPAALAVALAATLPAAVRQWRASDVSPLLVKFPVFPPATTTFAAAIGQVPSTQLAVSPDGQFLAFVATSPGKRSALWLRPIGATEATLLEGTDDASYPFWAPDSRSIAFFAANQLRRVDRTGGSPREICDVGADPRGGAWNQQHVIVFARDTASGLSRVGAEGGTPVPLLDLRPGEHSYRWPSFLPDGRRFLFHVRANTGRSIHIGSLDGPGSTMVLDNAPYAAMYSPPGHLLTVRDGTLLAYPFDERALSIVGDGIPIADHIGGSTSLRASFSVSPAGVLAYAGPLLTPGRLEWFDRDGTAQGTATETVGDYVNFRVSPDRRRVAVTQVDQRTNTTDIWLLDLSRGFLDRFTDNAATDTTPIWSRDGTRILFRSDRAGGSFPFERPADRSTPERRVGAVETLFLTDWSSDEKLIAFHSSTAATGSYDAGVLTLGADAKPRFVGESKYTEVGGQFSPDRRWFAYSSDASGEMEVYVAPYAGGAGQRVSTNGGSEPRWRGDSAELFYLAADRKLMVVGIGPGLTLTPTIPRALFQTTALFPGSIFRMNYDVTTDGFRFLVNRPVEGAGTSPITVVLNWATGLKK
jgi:serine/threonine protein kinase/Tol biopolymer transport system component